MSKARRVKAPAAIVCTQTALSGTLFLFTWLKAAGSRRSRPETKISRAKE